MIGNCSMRLTISVSNSLSSDVESRLFPALFQLWIIVFAVIVPFSHVESYIIVAQLRFQMGKLVQLDWLIGFFLLRTRDIRYIKYIFDRTGI